MTYIREPRPRPGFVPIRVVSCFDCGQPRVHDNGRPLMNGSPCLNCGSLVRLAPRKPGQVKGDAT